MPAVANQKVNVDSHVLSQDVDMHAPPIIFRNQDTNDIPITSGTYTNGVKHHVVNPPRIEQHKFHQIPVGNFISDNNRSPFVVDIHGINSGMQNEDGESSVSGEVSDENAPIYSQAPSIHDQTIDQHREDDYENEQGEVIQESNAVPHLVSSDQSLSENVNQISTYAKLTTKHKDQKVPFTQTEENNLWNKYPTTSELNHVTFTTERPTINQITSQLSKTTSAYRKTFGDSQVKLQIPSVPPALVNDMYALPINRNQTLKPMPPHLTKHINRIPGNKQVFYGHPHAESRPVKFANVGTPHHITLQNLPIPPHVASAIQNEAYQLHHSRRPILNNQKPFSRYPIHHYKHIPTNYSLHQSEPVKPNWLSSKPFDHFAPNTVQTTTAKYATSTSTDQALQTSDIVHSLGTQRPFVKFEPSYEITHSTNPTTILTPPKIDGIDLSRGKPFKFMPQQSVKMAQNLNIGEEKPSYNSNENDGPHVTEPSQIVTTAEEPRVPMVDEMYPKTPVTEMQPPPTDETKYRPYTQKHVPAISSLKHQNLLIEEVMGLHPPPIPKFATKPTPPSEGHGNPGMLPVMHNSPPNSVHKPNPLFSITAPTPYPDSPSFVTHFKSYDEVSTENVNRPEIITSSPEPTVIEKNTDDTVRVHTMYHNDHRDTIVAENLPTTTEKPVEQDDMDEYVRFAFDTRTPAPQKPLKQQPAKISSNGHMPQSPHFDESHFTRQQPPRVIIDESPSKSHDVIAAIQPTATVTKHHETTEVATETIHDTKVFTVTTTRTTVHNRGVTSTILLTLTRTRTSTIVDTITHTLVKPTRVTHEPTIKATIFTAPITMQKQSGSASSIIPNPSFSIYAIGSAHDESEHEHDSSNVSSEEIDDIHDIHEIRHMISPTPKVPSAAPIEHVMHSANGSNDSIFVVMTDKKKLGTINLSNELLDSMQNISANVGHDGASAGTQKKSQVMNGAIDNVSTEDDGFFDNLPKRDEDDNTNDVSHVLLGGILIATPPRSSESKNNGVKSEKKQPSLSTYDINPVEELDEHLESQGAAIIEETRTTLQKSQSKHSECQPDCKAVDNEVCQIVDNLARCVCRPGFARMFLDRPCKRKSFSMFAFVRILILHFLFSYVHIHIALGRFTTAKSISEIRGCVE